MKRSELISKICDATKGIDAVEASTVLRALGEVLRALPADEAMALVADLIRDRD